MSRTGANDLMITRGACVAMFAYDVGFAVDLDAAEGRIASRADVDGHRETILHRRRAPRYFEYRPLPLAVTRAWRGGRVAGFEVPPLVEMTVWDFGAVSVAYSVPLSCGFERLLDLADGLYENEELLRDSREQVELLMGLLGDSVRRAGVREVAEDYVAIHVAEAGLPAGCGSVAEWIEGNRQTVARVLRAEREHFSAGEVDEALSARLSYGERDATIVDWNAALIFDVDARDTLAVLEFANVELLELRALDDVMDAALDEAYEAVQKKQLLAGVLRGGPARLRRIARLQMDSAVLFEGVNNALKLLGDQYLARLYRMTAERLHLPEWDAAVLRKLATLESVYQKMADRQAGVRMEILEWIVIVLIAVEVVGAFWR